MPSFVSNNLIVKGQTAKVHAFVAAVKNGNAVLDFNKLIPMPAALEGVSPAKIQTEEEIATLKKKWDADKVAGKLSDDEKDGPIGLGITKEQHESLITKYGSADWMGWSLTNWGTKWGSCDDGGWLVVEGKNGNATGNIGFDTAWKFPRAFFVNASKKFPTLTFDLEFAAESGDFVGKASFKNGKVYKEVEYDWNSKDGIRIRKKVGQGPLEDDDTDA